MDVHFAVSFQIQNLRHPHPRKVPGSTQKWQEGIGVALTAEALAHVTDGRNPRIIIGHAGMGKIAMLDVA